MHKREMLKKRATPSIMYSSFVHKNNVSIIIYSSFSSTLFAFQRLVFNEVKFRVLRVLNRDIDKAECIPFANRLARFNDRVHHSLSITSQEKAGTPGSGLSWKCHHPCSLHPTDFR